MTLPKKIKGAVNPAGMEERKALLCRHGYERPFSISRRRKVLHQTISSTQP